MEYIGSTHNGRVREIALAGLLIALVFLLLGVIGRPQPNVSALISFGTISDQVIDAGETKEIQLPAPPGITPSSLMFSFYEFSEGNPKNLVLMTKAQDIGEKLHLRLLLKQKGTWLFTNGSETRRYTLKQSGELIEDAANSSQGSLIEKFPESSLSYIVPYLDQSDNKALNVKFYMSGMKQLTIKASDRQAAPNTFEVETRVFRHNGADYKELSPPSPYLFRVAYIGVPLADDSPADISEITTLSAYEDQDGDHIADNTDNCPFTANPEQDDVDNNGVGDSCELATAERLPVP